MNTESTLVMVGVERPTLAKYQAALTGAFVFLLSLGLFALNWPYTLSNGNLNLIGGVSTVGAMRVLQGEAPYRDFWTAYAPGQFYLLALIFRILGGELYVEVMAASIVSALAVLACYWLVKKLTDQHWISLLCAGIFAAAFFNTGYYFRLDAYPPAILCVFLSLNFVVNYYQSFQRRQLLWAGLMTGLSTLFSYDVGIYTALAIIAGLLFFHWRSPLPTNTRWRFAWSAFLTYLGSALLLVLPVVIYFAWVAGHELWQAIFTFCARDWRLPGPKPELNPLHFELQAASRSEMLDNFLRYIKYTTPFVLHLFGLFGIGLALRKGKVIQAALGATLVVAYWQHFYFAHIHINTHIVTMSAYAAAASALLYSVIASELNRRRLLILNVVAGLLVGGWAVALTGRSAYNILHKYRDPSLVTVQLPGIAGFKVMPEEATSLNALVTFVDQQVAPDQAIYVGLTRHDIMLTNDMEIYFALQRPIAVPYHEMHPAIADTANAQQEMIAGLERSQPPLIITKGIFADEVLEQVKANYQSKLPDIGAQDLDRYIHEHYVFTNDFSPYYVWTRKTDVQ